MYKRQGFVFDCLLNYLSNSLKQQMICLCLMKLAFISMVLLIDKFLTVVLMSIIGIFTAAVFQKFILSKICYNKFKLEQLCLLKVKGFQTPDQIRENMMRQLTTILKELFKFKKKERPDAKIFRYF